MPRRDGTGPDGFGPMTGRGMGYCSGIYAPYHGWYGAPRRHMRRRWFFMPPINPPQDSRTEKQILEEEHRYLEEELKQIKERLDSLSKE